MSFITFTYPTKKLYFNIIEYPHIRIILKRCHIKVTYCILFVIKVTMVKSVIIVVIYAVIIQYYRHLCLILFLILNIVCIS